MATYYVDPAATGANDGSSWSDAFTDLQRAVNACVGAGNIIYAKGTQTLTSGGTATIDFSLAASGSAGKYNKIIGCNASGEVDATKFVIDGNSNNGTVGITWKTSTFWWLQHIRVTRCSSNGCGGVSAYATSWILYDVQTDNNNGHGMQFNTYSSVTRLLYKCSSFNNTGSGYYSPRDSWLIFCAAYGNTSSGIYGHGTCNYGCLTYDNAQQSIVNYGGCSINCVSDDNGNNATHYGIGNSYTGALTIGCRTTNNYGYGLNASSTTLTSFFLHNFSDGNLAGHITNAGAAVEIENVLDGVQGYVNRANKDFNLTADATMRRVPITLSS